MGQDTAAVGFTTISRRCLDTWRAAGTFACTGEIARRIEALAATYDLDAIHDLLVPPHNYT